MTLPSFAEFFAAVNGHAPFPWQVRLAAQVLREGWPELLDLPTGTGKTSALDVALYALAAAPERMPRRTLLVVDRRIVVDQGAEHARAVRERMSAREAPAAAQAIASKLRALWGAKDDEPPFAIATMRGGMPRDNDWARRPDQPVLGVSTIDQVGSRLLFRGYGVSARSASIHAGMLGNDTLILLDEVHLATAFAETLRAICARYRDAVPGLPARFKVVEMSATPGEQAAGATPFVLGDEDRAHPVLAQRLGARKPARLVRVDVRGDHEVSKRGAVAERAVEEALKLHEAGARAICVVVNRVDTARVAWRALEAHEATVDRLLVTGRMRPIDRDRLVRDELTPKVGAGRPRDDAARPIVVVATQCIEAGADLDFDAMVTECASLDALRQRLGRLDRRGAVTAARGQAAAVILCRSDLAKDKSDDPVYGEALGETWRWLEAQANDGVVGFGILELPALPAEPEALAALLAPVAHAPVLLPAHLDALAHTSEVLEPRPGPDPSLWLHGPKRKSSDVQVAWRADLLADARLAGEAPGQEAVSDEEATPRSGSARARGSSSEREAAKVDASALAAKGSPRRSHTFLDELALVRPSALETVTLPLYAVRAWLCGKRDAVGTADVVGERIEEAPARWREHEEEPRGRPVVRLRRGEAATWVAVTATAREEEDDVRPGDTLLVPSSYGGINRDGTFDPEDPSSVSDLGDLAQLRGRGRATLRTSPAALRAWGLDEALVSAAPLAAEGHEAKSARQVKAELRAWIMGWPEEPPAGFPGHPAEWRVARQVLAGKQLTPNVVEDNRLIAVAPVPRGRLHELRDPDWVGDAVTEDDDSSFRSNELSLRVHSGDVRRWAKEFALALGFSEELIGDLSLAGWLHDVGKADPRFQRWLVGGDEVRASLLAEPLAKSALAPGRRDLRELAQARAGYPRGYRHELLSLAMIEASEAALVGAHDRELVRHLVASHHGWCRPHAPPLDHPDDFAVALQHDAVPLTGTTRHKLARANSGVAARFWALNERYGWWGLAWLESVLRLADHRASEERERGLVDEAEAIAAKEGAS